jgi:hypothetical protein
MEKLPESELQSREILNPEIVQVDLSFEDKTYLLSTEFRKKTIEYSSDIQKETGFWGYERTTVDWEGIMATYREILRDHKIEMANEGPLEELLSLEGSGDDNEPKDYDKRDEWYKKRKIKSDIQNGKYPIY